MGSDPNYDPRRKHCPGCGSDLSLRASGLRKAVLRARYLLPLVCPNCGRHVWAPSMRVASLKESLKTAKRGVAEARRGVRRAETLLRNVEAELAHARALAKGSASAGGEK